VPPATLNARLRELEEAGILERRVTDSRPPLVEYRLTQQGNRLRTLVTALAEYATR
jgi:DNA-binding HxlR family transcriptional regulator